MQIRQIYSDKRQFLDLLLLADEQENMIDRYLDRGEMFALYDGEVKTVCVVTAEGNGVYELKNIATRPEAQNLGYGKQMIAWLFKHYRKQARTILVGTGNVPTTLSFYQSCGFVVSHRVPGFFTTHYDHPIYENGLQLVDMVYLKKDF